MTEVGSRSGKWEVRELRGDGGKVITVGSGSAKKIFKLKYSTFSYYFYNSGNTAWFPTIFFAMGRYKGVLSCDISIYRKLY